jgi:hypothetical protein
MANVQKIHDENQNRHRSKAIIDLVLLIVATIVVVILSYFFDIFVLIVRFLQKHPEKIVYIDEVIMALVTLSIGLAVFSWRRWMDLKKETAERIKKQEELLSLANTKADVERIINKQLRFDMDMIKQDVREILNRLIGNSRKSN